jgi:polar amino acid transport system permease protein
MTFDVDYAWHLLPELLRASLVTLEATILGFGLALAGGLVLAIARRARLRAIRLLAGTLVEVIRSTPLLIQLFLLFYVLPDYGIQLSALTTGVIGLGIHYSTYTSEVYRAGIESIPRGQWEAAAALNLSRAQTWRRIILPQAIPPVVPALGNYLIGMYKDTPVLAIITVQELLGTALASANRTFRYFEPITLVALIFLVLSLVSSLVIRLLERRLAS